MKRKDIDYWWVLCNIHNYSMEHQLECEVYWKSYCRIHKILEPIEEWVSREYDEDMF